MNLNESIINLAEKLNKMFNTEDFKVYKLTSGELHEE